MEKKDIAASAAALTPPPAIAADAYSEHKIFMAHKVSGKLTARGDLQRLIGEGNLSMMQDNHINHALYMDSIFHDFDPEPFVETILWVFRTYRRHGFHETYWAAQLNCWLQVMEEELPEEHYAPLKPFYEWMIIHIPDFSLLSENSVSTWEVGPHD